MFFVIEHRNGLDVCLCVDFVFSSLFRYGFYTFKKKDKLFLDISKRYWNNKTLTNLSVLKLTIEFTWRYYSLLNNTVRVVEVNVIVYFKIN